jgi:hypothetical protein
MGIVYPYQTRISPFEGEEVILIPVTSNRFNPVPKDPINQTRPKCVTVVDAMGFKRVYPSQQAVCNALNVSYSKLLTWLDKNGTPVTKGKRMGYRFFRGAY